MRHTFLRFAFLLAIIATLFLTASAQSLPRGDWQLVSYNFKNKVAYPVDKSTITLNVRRDGKLGGNSGCNAYGGRYSLENERLQISDIISTMRACVEPTPDFEHSFFTTLESATEFKFADGKLTITDPKTKNFLRFELVDKKLS